MSITSIILIAVAVIVVLTFGTTFVVLHKTRKRSLEVALERTNTVTDEFVDNPIKSGVYIFTGAQGAGKSSLMYAMLSVDFMYHGQARLLEGQRDIDMLNAIPQVKPYKLTMPACAYRTRTKVILPNGKPTYHTDISQFGLPGKPGVQYFPKGTVIACEEIDSFMDCRKWQEDKQNIIDGLKYIRHNNLVFMGDCQNFDKLDKSIRRLTTDLIFIEDKRDIWHTVTTGRFIKRTRREFYGTEWTFIWTKRQLLENATITAHSMGVDKVSGVENYVRRCKFLYRGNIYSQYDSFSGKAYWYNGLNSYEVEDHVSTGFSREGISDFVKRNPLSKDDTVSDSETKNKEKSTDG